MRRVGTAALTAALAAGVALGLAGCGADAVGSGPPLPTIDPRPKLVLVLRDDGIHAERGPRPDEGVVPGSTPGADSRVDGGTLAVVRNDTDRDHRLTGDGGKAFDTGVLHPGEQVAVVLVNGTGDDRTIEVLDPDDPHLHTKVRLSVRSNTDL